MHKEVIAVRYRVSFLSTDEEEGMKASLSSRNFFAEYVAYANTPNEAIELSNNNFLRDNPDLRADDFFISVSWSKKDE